jgi:hypothetical protein
MIVLGRQSAARCYGHICSWIADETGRVGSGQVESGNVERVLSRLEDRGRELIDEERVGSRECSG